MAVCTFVVLSGCGLLPSFPTTPNWVNSCVSALEIPFIFQSLSFVSSDPNSHNGRVLGNALRTGHTYKYV